MLSLQGIWLSEEKALLYLDEIAEYPRLYNALGIVCHAAPRDSNWVGNAIQSVERRCDEIYRRWAEMPGRKESDNLEHPAKYPLRSAKMPLPSKKPRQRTA